MQVDQSCMVHDALPVCLLIVHAKMCVQVDLSCMVSTIRWYHELENGTEVMRPARGTDFI